MIFCHFCILSPWPNPVFGKYFQNIVLSQNVLLILTIIIEAVVSVGSQTVQKVKYMSTKEPPLYA